MGQSERKVDEKRERDAHQDQEDGAVVGEFLHRLLVEGVVGWVNVLVVASRTGRGPSGSSRIAAAARELELKGAKSIRRGSAQKKGWTELTLP